MDYCEVIYDPAPPRPHVPASPRPRVSVTARAVYLFLRARACDKFFLRAASTLGITDGEQRAL